MEIWKDIPGFDGIYQASSEGRVRSLRYGKVKVLSQTSQSGGYKTVSLRCQGKETRRYVHRLVLTTFAGDPPCGMEACHNDGVRANNRLENLRWDTRRGNHADKKKHGTQHDTSGSRHGQAKLNEKSVTSIRARLLEGEKPSALALEYRVSLNTILNAQSRKTWRHV